MAQTKTSPLTVAIDSLRGVGPKLKETFTRLEISTVGDLLFHTPRRYTRIGQIRPLDHWKDGDTARIEVTVREARVRHGAKIDAVVAKAFDENGKEIQLTWFGQRWLARRLPDMKIVCQGTLSSKKCLRLDVREWEESNDLPEEERKPHLRPVYPATGGLKQGRILSFMDQALSTLGDLKDPLPKEVRERFSLPTIKEALVMVHQPLSPQDVRIGRRRLVFDELFPSQLALLLLRRRDEKLAAPALNQDTLSWQVIENLPFELSEGQKQAWEHIQPRLRSSIPSRTLLQGEVGSGKTVLAALAAAQASASNRLTSILVPTEILAQQHYSSLRTFLASVGVSVEIITGSQPKREREEALKRLQSGESLVVVGTHALLFGELKSLSGKLGVVVVDEQHRFGVKQRHALIEGAASEGKGVHFLQLSATPIPRTLTMTFFGDLDVVNLMSRAEASRQVQTRISLGWIDAIISSAKRGAASFIICPRIDEDIIAPGAAVLSPELAYELTRSKLRFALAHGRQSLNERSQAIKDLAMGNLDVLLATTVIEVGIDVGRADTIVILDADHFGLAQLHQLRGRVGRLGQKAHCVLVPSPSIDEEGLNRLEAMVEMTDGLALAQYDLELRGSGSLVGSSQAGHKAFKIASLARDGRTLVEARHAAKLMLKEDPTLKNAEHRAVREDILIRISQMLRINQT